MAAQGRGALQVAVGAVVEVLAERGEQTPQLLLRVGEQVLVEGQVYPSQPERPQRHVVVYTPEEEVALEAVAGGPNSGLHRQKEIVYEGRPLHCVAAVGL